jgi:hypothetical protein
MIFLTFCLFTQKNPEILGSSGLKLLTLKLCKYNNIYLITKLKSFFNKAKNMFNYWQSPTIA